MNFITVCPDASSYAQLMRGNALPDADALLGHLETCVACQRTVESLSDPSLTDALRTAASAPGGEMGRVEEIISRCRRLGVDDTGMSTEGLNAAQPAALTGTDLFAAPLPGERLGGYRLLRLLGKGGMGMVYEAEDERLRRRVALKLMKPELAGVLKHRERFLHEARTAARVESDHVCPIHQVGEENGVAFIAMPLLKGEPLDATLRREGKLSIAEATCIAREIAEGLTAAHAAGLVHRDVKPANVWLETMPKGPPRVRLLDFGLARAGEGDAHLTQSGTILGTPAYLAPEQARAQTVDGRADLFSLGVLLYEMLAGTRPFTGVDAYSILTSLALDAPTSLKAARPDVPAWLDRLVMHLLEKKPQDRPSSAAEVVERLTTPPVETPRAETVTLAAVPAAPRRKRGALAYAAVALALLFVVGGGLAAYQLIFKTANGTLIVEVEDDAEVRFKDGKLQVYGDDGKVKYTLKPSDKNKGLPPGKYRVAVEGVDGLTLDTETFEIKKQGRVIVRVTMAAVVKKDASKSAAETERKAAEWVLSVGGQVGVWADGQVKMVTAAKDLPATPFELRVLYAPDNKQVTDEGLSLFKGNKTLTTLQVQNANVTDAGLAHFRDCKNLTWIVLIGTQVTDAGLARFTGCKRLRHLSLASTQATDAGLAHFTDCKELEFLDLYFTKVTDAGLARFAGCKSLTGLRLDSTKVTDAGLAHFSGCKSLTLLHLTHTKVTDAGLANFKECKNLVTLSLGGTQLTDAGLAHFSGCKSLTYLHLNSTKTTDAGLGHFKGCESLTGLSLADTAVTDAGLSNFKDCKRLARLFLSDTKVTAAGLAPFANRKSLVQLEFETTAVGDECVKTLSGMTNLELLMLRKTKVAQKGIAALAKALPRCRIEHDGGVIDPNPSPDRKAAEWVLSIGGQLNVSVNGGETHVKTAKDLPAAPFEVREVYLDGNTKVTDAGLAAFKGCKSVQGLDLRGTAVTDAGLAAFKECKRLTSLNLGGCPEVTDAGLAHFAGCESLQRLTLLQCTNVTNAGLAHFKTCKALTELRLHGNSKVTDAGLAHVAGCKKLETLSLVGTGATDAGMAHFTECKSLTELDLRGTKITDVGLAHFKGCDNLLDLWLTATQTSDVGLAHFGNCKKLQGLHLGSTKVTDAGLAHFSGCKSLTSLGLHVTKTSDVGLTCFKGCKSLVTLGITSTAVSDDSLPLLAGFAKLETLSTNGSKLTAKGIAALAKALPKCRIDHDGGVIDPSPDRRAAEWVLSIGGGTTIWSDGKAKDVNAPKDLPATTYQLGTVVLNGNKQVTDEGLSSLKGCKNLTHLSLHNTKVTDAGLAHLKEARNLVNVQLSSTQVTDAGLAHLSDCKNLIVLSLDHTRVTDAGLAHFSGCPNLRDLWLEGTQVSDKGLAHLAGCKKLQLLNLGGTRVTDAGLVHFANCKELNSLNLVATQVGDKGIAHFAGCKNLKWLKLSQTQMSDVGLAHFAGCKNLKDVRLDGTKVTDAGLAQLKDCKNLLHLDLTATQVTDAGLPHVSACTNLNRVIVLKTKLTAKGIAALAKALPRCRIDHDGGVIDPGADRKAAEWVLSIGGGVLLLVDGKQVNAAKDLPAAAFTLVGVSLPRNKQATDESLARLKDCKELLSLTLDETPVTDAGLAHFAGCKQLTFLSLPGTKISDAGLANFAECKSLTTLDVRNTKVADKGLANFKGRELRHLWLSYTQTSDAGLAHFAGCKSLVDLNLDGTKITDEGLAHLKGCASLAHLGLGNTKTSSVGLAHLKDCTELSGLNLENNAAIGDDSATTLAGFAKLTSIDLTKTKFTQKGIDALKKALPKCKIEWEAK